MAEHPEILDIYDENAKPTGKTILRGTPIRNGEYSLSVHMYIYTPKGKFLLQKRSTKKRSLPGIWSVTCGAVKSGEDSITAGIREAKEEVGLDIPSEAFRFIEKIKRRHSFIDLYFVEIDFDINDCKLQKDEVDSVRMCSAPELLALIRCSESSNSSYAAAVGRAMKNLNLI